MERAARWTIIIATLLIAATFTAAGLAKINNPAPTSDFLVELIAYRNTSLVRALGFGELALALWLISGAGRTIAAISAAAMFTTFAVTHVYATASGVESACGCLGTSNWTTSIPTWGWVVGNTALAVTASAIAAPVPRRVSTAPSTMDDAGSTATGDE